MLSNTYTRMIEWGDCDPAGIVFNPQFFRFFDHGTALLYGAAGWPKPRMLERFGVAGCPLVSTEASFHSPCRYGDQVAIVSSIVELGRSSFRIEHKLNMDGVLCVAGKEVRVWTVRDAHGALKSAAIPDEVRAAFGASQGS